MRIQTTLTAFAAALLLAPAAAAQRVSLGAMVGGYGNSDFFSSYVPAAPFLPGIVETSAGGYIVGPAVEVRLFPRLGVGAEALYKRLRYRTAASFQNGAVIGFAPATVVTWQFPVLARYRFALGGTRPFVEGGPSFRAAGNLNSADPSHVGATAGVGVEFEWHKLRIAPRVRYTRWAADPAWSVRTRPDQLEFLAGFSYGAGSAFDPLGGRVSFGVVLVSHVAGEVRPSTYPSGDMIVRTESDPRGPAAGPLVEVKISPHAAVEATAIPRTYRFTSRVIDASPFRPLAYSGSSSATWEFPVWLKYRLAAGSWRPFAAVGPAFRLPKEVGGMWLANYGVTAGAGMGLRAGRFRIEPALRYTHWGPERPRVFGATGDSGVRRNQVQVSVGVSTLPRGEEDLPPPGGRVRLGAVLAAPVTGEFRTSTDVIDDIFMPVTLRTASAPRGPALGPLVEVGLTPRLSVEGSAIRRRFRASSGVAGGERFPFAASWEFPVAVKYRLATGAWRPFLAAGPSFREPVETGDGRLSSWGVSAAAGLEYSWKGATFAPALRYTRWAADGSRIYRNQVQAVIGISLGGRRGSM